MDFKPEMFTEKLWMLVLMNRKSTNSSGGINLVIFMSPTNFPNMVSWTRLLINGFIRPLFSIKVAHARLQILNIQSFETILRSSSKDDPIIMIGFPMSFCRWRLMQRSSSTIPLSKTFLSLMTSWFRLFWWLTTFTSGDWRFGKPHSFKKLGKREK